MQRRTKMFYCSITLFFLVLLLAGCKSNNKEEPIDNSSSKQTSASQTGKKSKESSLKNEKRNESESTTATEEAASNPTDNNSTGETNNKQKNTRNKSDKHKPLSKYSSQQIEYARVWLQLGTNQAIDELNVRHISAGTPLNPDDEISASYPEDVIQLAGARLVDGSITYHGNGNGTINVYNVLLRWDGKYPAGEQFYLDIIKHTKRVTIETGNEEKVIKLIDKMTIQ